MAVSDNSNHSDCATAENQELSREEKDDPILCPHCKRTATNGIKCKGICVSDSDY